MKPSCGRSALSYDRPEFFRVFLPDFSSHQLEIPPAFLRQLKGNLAGKAILKDHTRKSWLVDLEELNDDVVFKNGWRAFADDHRLEYGDFLIFQYEGNYVFSVKIFGKNGCTKEVPPIVDHFVTHVTIKDEPDLIQTPDQKLLEVESRGRAGRPRRRATSPLKSHTARHASSKYPRYEITISKWCLYYVHVSKTVMDEYNIEFSQNVVLQDEKGKEWPVKINRRRKGHYNLGSGWSNFCGGNNVRVNDKCIFEFVLDRRSVCKQMNVKIIHKPD